MIVVNLLTFLSVFKRVSSIKDNTKYIKTVKVTLCMDHVPVKNMIASIVAKAINNVDLNGLILTSENTLIMLNRDNLTL